MAVSAASAAIEGDVCEAGAGKAVPEASACEFAAATMAALVCAAAARSRERKEYEDGAAGGAAAEGGGGGGIAAGVQKGALARGMLPTLAPPAVSSGGENRVEVVEAAVRGAMVLAALPS